MGGPEDKARQKIDELLSAAGWTIQDRADFDRTAALGVAVREFALPNGEADYLLFVDGRAAGVVEAKKSGSTLSGASDQSEKYMGALPPHLASWGPNLVFDYESTGDETYLRLPHQQEFHAQEQSAEARRSGCRAPWKIAPSASRGIAPSLG